MADVRSMIARSIAAGPVPTFRLSEHARKQAKEKGFSLARVGAAAEDPALTYPSGRYPDQERRIRDGIVTVVNVRERVIVTVYVHAEETDVRPDQTDDDARRYAEKRNAR